MTGALEFSGPGKVYSGCRLHGNVAHHQWNQTGTQHLHPVETQFSRVWISTRCASHHVDARWRANPSIWIDQANAERGGFFSTKSDRRYPVAIADGEASTRHADGDRITMPCRSRSIAVSDTFAVRVTIHGPRLCLYRYSGPRRTEQNVASNRPQAVNRLGVHGSEAAVGRRTLQRSKCSRWRRRKRDHSICQR